MRKNKQLTKATKGKALAQQDAGFEDKLTSLRKTHGIKERVEVPFRCSQTGGKALYIYERVDPRELFRLVETKKVLEEPKAMGFFNRSTGASASNPSGYDSNAFDNAGRSCPWCASNRFVVDCPKCHEATCGGTIRTKPNDQEWHRCHPECGYGAELGPAHKVQGRKSQSRAPSLARSQRAALPGKNLPRLPKRK